MRSLKIFLICLIVISIAILADIIKKENNEKNNFINLTNSKIEEVQIENQLITEITKVTENEEQKLEIQETENEGFKEQGEISYNGSEKNPKIEVGKYEGLTYYSQIDNRWKDKNYSAIGDVSQTIGSSGCGPTSGSIIVSSIKGKITPDVMADLYLKYGYRSSNQGTYWSAFKWTADVFNIEYKEAYKLDDAINMLNQGYYIIASCNQGLFTYGGHFIVLVGIEGNKIRIFDPYLYSTKFETSTRRGLAEIQGNSVYVSINNFREYANYRKFFCFKNDRTEIKENQTKIIEKESNIKSENVNYKVKITANIGLRIRTGASTAYSILGAYAKGTIKTIYAESNGWGKTEDGWIYLGYTNKVEENTTNALNNNIKNTQKYIIGTYKVNCSKLNVRVGPGTNYRIKNFNELSLNARINGGYIRNVKCTVYEVKGEWGRTPSGWVCLKYCKKV